MIVSVSRRCDIPRFQFEWFMARLDAGFADVVNPYNANQIRRVSLLPENPDMPSGDGVDALVFWTRDPRNILDSADELTGRGFRFYVMTTITGYPAELEPGRAQIHGVLSTMKKLSQKIGPERVIWRYDPILLSSITSENFHLENFNVLARELSGSVRRVIISLYTEYRGSKRRLEELEKNGVLRLTNAAAETGGRPADLLTGLAQSARAAGMEIQSCAAREDYSPFGIKAGACIDPALIENLYGKKFSGKDKNQRPNCLCLKSVDLGSYGTCGARCVYCYAR